MLFTFKCQQFKCHSFPQMKIEEENERIKKKKKFVYVMTLKHQFHLVLQDIVWIH